ncbi:7419_t:CDS:2 [Diversispora eburnea]|uniref:Derlin n=1 Tax=Diversispora eburnea TaxID=1213867 RepID=A0A9N9GA53_9GLOM|nr:7419_t:CDS:2 [Diversispora eburnea]
MCNFGQQRQPPNELALWYGSIPICTKFLFTSFIAVTLIEWSGRLDPRLFAYIPEEIYKGFQDLETTKFAGRTADYVYFLLMEAGLILIAGWLFEIRYLNQSLLMSIIYLWSQQNPYFPWVLLIFDFLQMGGRIPWNTLIGIITGHIFYFLHDLYPASGGTRFLNTPQWLYRIFTPPPVSINNGGGGIRTSFGTVIPPTSGNRSSEGREVRHRWGSGQRLGSE